MNYGGPEVGYDLGYNVGFALNSLNRYSSDSFPCVPLCKIKP